MVPTRVGTRKPGKKWSEETDRKKEQDCSGKIVVNDDSKTCSADESREYAKKSEKENALEETCRFYVKNGWCRYSWNCKFQHPGAYNPDDTSSTENGKKELDVAATTEGVVKEADIDKAALEMLQDMSRKQIDVFNKRIGFELDKPLADIYV